jgi:ATPase family associated with various cellular activities (AAA)
LIQGFSLGMKSPALARVPPMVKGMVADLCRSLEAGEPAPSLWILGGPESGKTALCSYLAQQLAPSGEAIVERSGDLLAELRWLAASEGQLDLEGRLQELTEAPLLVIDDIDRPIRSRAGGPLTFETSCTHHDLMTLARLLSDRQDSLRPLVLSSRSTPARAAAQVAAISRPDLVRALLATASGRSDPIEDFPEYPAGLLRGAMRTLEEHAVICDLEHSGPVAAAA